MDPSGHHTTTGHKAQGGRCPRTPTPQPRYATRAMGEGAGPLRGPMERPVCGAAILKPASAARPTEGPGPPDRWTGHTTEGTGGQPRRGMHIPAFQAISEECTDRAGGREPGWYTQDTTGACIVSASPMNCGAQADPGATPGHWPTHAASPSRHSPPCRTVPPQWGTGTLDTLAEPDERSGAQFRNRSPESVRGRLQIPSRGRVAGTPPPACLPKGFVGPTPSANVRPGGPGRDRWISRPAAQPHPH